MWDKFMFLKDLFKIYNKESSDDKDRVIREGPIFNCQRCARHIVDSLCIRVCTAGLTFVTGTAFLGCMATFYFGRYG